MWGCAWNWAVSLVLRPKGNASSSLNVYSITRPVSNSPHHISPPPLCLSCGQFNYRGSGRRRGHQPVTRLYLNEGNTGSQGKLSLDDTNCPIYFPGDSQRHPVPFMFQLTQASLRYRKTTRRTVCDWLRTSYLYPLCKEWNPRKCSSNGKLRFNNTTFLLLHSITSYLQFSSHFDWQ